MKTALVLGAGGFIGNHMVRHLKEKKIWVRGVDLKKPEFESSEADDFVIGDLRSYHTVYNAMVLENESNTFDEIYQFAADMGGAGFIFTGENDAEIMHNSASINLNVLEAMHQLNLRTLSNKTKIFYSSSACVYPSYNQLNPSAPNCEESSAYPAEPDSEYGWEKLFSERMYFAYHRNYGIRVKVARFHNIFGPQGTWEGGREKAPAAICRKIALASSNDQIEVWGDGEQTRSFLYIDECVDAIVKFMNHPSFIGPVNIGSEEMVTINQLVDLTAKIAGKKIKKIHIPGPLGVRGRNSDNSLINKMIGWDSHQPLELGIEKTYTWILDQVVSNKSKIKHSQEEN